MGPRLSPLLSVAWPSSQRPGILQCSLAGHFLSHLVCLGCFLVAWVYRLLRLPFPLLAENKLKSFLRLLGRGPRAVSGFFFSDPCMLSYKY